MKAATVLSSHAGVHALERGLGDPSHAVSPELQQLGCVEQVQEVH
jgi:hypothetical protein